MVIDTIGYAPFEPAKLRNLGELVEAVQRHRAHVQGGQRHVDTQFSNVIDEISKQYVATFEIALAGGDGKDHTFQAIVDNNGTHRLLEHRQRQAAARRATRSPRRARADALVAVDAHRARRRRRSSGSSPG